MENYVEVVDKFILLLGKYGFRRSGRLTGEGHDKKNQLRRSGRLTGEGHDKKFSFSGQAVMKIFILHCEKLFYSTIVVFILWNSRYRTDTFDQFLNFRLQMKRWLRILVVCFYIFPLISQAQYYYYNDRYYDSKVLFELGCSIGGMNCLTDLGGKQGVGKKFIKDVNVKNTRPAFSIYTLFMYQDALCARLELSFGNITAYDSILKNASASTSGRYERSLNFKSTIADLQFAIEIHPLFFYARGEKDPPHFSPYILVGIGYFSFNPQTKLNDNWYSLQPLHTEGQGFKEYAERREYKLHQVNFPVGAGIKYEVSPIVNMRFEFVYRILATDYLDDVSTSYIDPFFFAKYLTPSQADIAGQLADRQSEKIPSHVTMPGQQRGNPENKDAFFSLQLKIGIMIGRQKRK